MKKIPYRDQSWLGLKTHRSRKFVVSLVLHTVHLVSHVCYIICMPVTLYLLIHGQIVAFVYDDNVNTIMNLDVTFSPFHMSYNDQF